MPIPPYDSDIFALAYTADPLTGPATSVPVHAEVRIGNQTVYRGTVNVPIDATSPRETFLSRVSGIAIDQPVAAAIAARIVVVRGQATIELSNRTDQEPWPAVDTIVDLRIRILLQGKEIGHATCDISNRATAGSTLVPATWWEEGGNETAAALPDLIELEITGDPAASTDRYLRARGTAFSTAWAGTVHVKPSVQRR